MLVSNDELRGKAPLEMAEIQQYVNFADQELLPAVAGTRPNGVPCRRQLT